jgi:hypothetical protein
MKKLFAIIVMVTFALTAIIPSATADQIALQDEPAYLVSGKIVQGIGGTGAPIEIWGLWVEVVPAFDDDNTTDGCQVDPPMAYDGKVSVKFYAIVFDPDGDQQQIKFDLFYPDNVNDTGNSIYYPGDGSKVPARAGIQDGENIEPVMETQNKTHYEDDILPLNVTGNWFICFQHGKTPADVEAAWLQNDIWFKWVEYELYYHDPAGWYRVNVTAQDDDGNEDSKEMWFEYTPTLGIELDFDQVDWGTETALFKWYTNIPGGDWDFDVGPPPNDPPTMRNIGNWFTEVHCQFNSSNQGFADGDAFFDIRVGSENPAAHNYNQSYAQKYDPDATLQGGLTDPDHGAEHDNHGLKLDTMSKPLPIDNSWNGHGPYYHPDDVLKICHTAKLNFYIYPTQWSQSPNNDIYTIPMVIEVGLNTNLTGHQWPTERYPCTGLIR